MLHTPGWALALDGRSRFTSLNRFFFFFLPHWQLFIKCQPGEEQIKGHRNERKTRMWGTQTKEEEGRSRSQGKTAHYIHLPRPPPRGGQISAIMLCADLLGPVGMGGEIETTTFRLGRSNCDGRGRFDGAIGESGIGKTQRAMGPGGRNELSLKGKVEEEGQRVLLSGQHGCCP